MATIKQTKENAERLAHFQNRIAATSGDLPAPAPVNQYVRDLMGEIGASPAGARELLVNELVNELSRRGELMAFIQQPMSAIDTLNAMHPGWATRTPALPPTQP